MTQSRLMLGLLVLAGTLGSASSDAADRQYYGSWEPQPQRGYYVSRYYYKPRPTAPTYDYHMCIYYPSKPRYVYYYNPHTRLYWGRFDCQGSKGAQYSILAEKDRKANLKDIPEKSFPAPAKMPPIPEAEDEEPIIPVDVNGLPADLPAG